MDSVLISVSMFVVAQVVGGLIWALRLEGKVNLQEQRSTDLKELINERFDHTDERLSRIERSLNGYLRHD
jgi:hypothetical protein